MLNVCVQGLGFAGAAMATAISSAKNSTNSPLFYVTGVDLDNKIGNRRISLMNSGIFPFDTNDNTMKEALKKNVKRGNLKATSDPTVYKKADIVLIDIHLDIPFKEKKPKLKFGKFEKAIRTVASRIKQNTLVIVETTVPPGTCKKIILPIIKDEFSKRQMNTRSIKLAHSYERVMPGKNYLSSIINFWRVYSGINNKSANECEKFLKKVINTNQFPLTRLSNTTSSETAKVMENSYRTVNISFICEWTKFAEELGLDLFEIIDSIQKRPTHNNIRYPGFGIGGYCLTKDPCFAPASAKQLFNKRIKFPFAKLALQESEKMPSHVISRVKKIIGKSINLKKILLCGLSYRQDIADTRYSPSETFFKLFLKEGISLKCHDPLVQYWDEMKLKINNNLPKFSKFDVVIFAVPHKEYSELDFSQILKKNSNTLIMDACGLYNSSFRKKMRKYGIKIEAIGVGDGV